MQKLISVMLHPGARLVVAAALVLFVVLIAGLSSGDVAVYGQATEVRRGIGATGDETSGDGVYTLIENIINIFSIVVGVISVIMVIIGGLKYVLSGGDSNSVSSAKNTIIYAIVGLVVVVFAQVIVLFVLDEAAPGQSSESGEETSLEYKLEIA